MIAGRRVILGLVTLQRLGELVLARRNTDRLLAQGAYEVAAGHYPLIVALHAGWLAGLWYLGLGMPTGELGLARRVRGPARRCASG